MSLRERFVMTTVVRLSLIYIGAFALTSITLFTGVYLLTVRAMDADTDEFVETELLWLQQRFDVTGLIGLANAVRDRSALAAQSRSLYLLVDGDQQSVVGNLGGWPANAVPGRKWVEFYVDVPRGDTVEPHPIRAAVLELPDNYRLLVGTDVIHREHFQTVMARAGEWAVALVILLGSMIGVNMNRRLLRQVNSIAQAGQQIANGNFSQRLPLSGNDDELDQLVIGLNDLLERIEQLMLALRFVIDGTAHELRGPLNRLRLRLEQAQLAEPAEVHAQLDGAMKDAAVLLKTLESLLRIARAQSGPNAGEVTELDLSALARDMAELYQPLAEERGITFIQNAATPAIIHASRQLLAHAIANLLDNALKYTPTGGQVSLGVTMTGSDVVLTVTDNGPGIASEDRERALLRFVRLESAQHLPGSGLGLSLVAAVCRFHHARLTLDDAGPGLAVSMSFARSPGGDTVAP